MFANERVSKRVSMHFLLIVEPSRAVEVGTDTLVRFTEKVYENLKNF